VPHALKKFFLLFIVVALAAPAWAQRGALTIPRNLEQLTDRSANIVRGIVISARTEKHPDLSGLNTVVVRLQVKETLKGQARDTFTFRQYIWDIRDTLGAAGYRKGQDLLLMMIAPSEYGLSSPAGLEQGRFQIRRDSTGREFAVNGHGNFRLFDGISTPLANEGSTLSPRSSSLVQQHQKRPVELAELTGLIRELARGSE
jgi:hypothetical protein